MSRQLPRLAMFLRPPDGEEEGEAMKTAVDASVGADTGGNSNSVVGPAPGRASTKRQAPDDRYARAHSASPRTRGYGGGRPVLTEPLHKRRTSLFAQYDDSGFGQPPPPPMTTSPDGSFPRQRLLQHANDSHEVPHHHRPRGLPAEPIHPPHLHPASNAPHTSRSPTASSRPFAPLMYSVDSGQVYRYVRPRRAHHADETTTTEAKQVEMIQTEKPISANREPVQRERTSRYLSEEDRRSIITRIDNGEKQVALAKEYQVSRAAICNLYKNRREVMTRVDRNPKAKHPKRQTASKPSCQTAAATTKNPTEAGLDPVEAAEDPRADDGMSDDHSSVHSQDEASVPTVSQMTDSRESEGLTMIGATRRRLHNASMMSYPIQRLLSLLRDCTLPAGAYRRIARRLIRSVMEEVVSCLPREEIDISTPSGDRLVTCAPVRDEAVCAIALGDDSYCMLEAFTEIFATASTGTITVLQQAQAAASSPYSPEIICRPPALDGTNKVILLGTECATGDHVCHAVAHIIHRFHVLPSQIYLAILLSAQSAVDFIHAHFPDVTIIAGGIDEGIDENHRIRPGIGDFAERFWNRPPTTTGAKSASR